MRLLPLAALFACGCLDSVETPGDASAVVRDLAGFSSPGDGGQDGGQDGGTLNCTLLNMCESKCVDFQCVTDCRARATAKAVAAEMALQDCLNGVCPQHADLAVAICMPDGTGHRSAACASCIADSQVAPAGACSSASAPSCHQCYTQSQTCLHDS